MSFRECAMVIAVTTWQEGLGFNPWIRFFCVQFVSARCGGMAFFLQSKSMSYRLIGDSK